jgi:enoyl-[acyl-carrier protein] reductase II
LKTPLCDPLGINVPIVLAPMGTCTSGEFAAAVSNNGGLGGVGSLFRTAAAIKRDIDVVRKLTTLPFAINHIPQNLVAEAFDYALAARPAVMSFALADPGDLAHRARDVGTRIMIRLRRSRRPRRRPSVAPTSSSHRAARLEATRARSARWYWCRRSLRRSGRSRW